MEDASETPKRDGKPRKSDGSEGAATEQRLSRAERLSARTSAKVLIVTFCLFFSSTKLSY